MALDIHTRHFQLERTCSGCGHMWPCDAIKMWNVYRIVKQDLYYQTQFILEDLIETLRQSHVPTPGCNENCGGCMDCCRCGHSWPCRDIRAAWRSQRRLLEVNRQCQR